MSDKQHPPQKMIHFTAIYTKPANPDPQVHRVTIHAIDWTAALAIAERFDVPPGFELNTLYKQ